jgi:hypothetical protein
MVNKMNILRGLEILIYLIMVVFILIFFTGNGAFIYEGF